MTSGEIKRVARSFRKGILKKRCSDMMCAVVSYPLQGFLSVLGVETEVVEVLLKQSNHVFLRLADGRILDATADQFGGPPIYLGDPQWYHTERRRIEAVQKEGK